MPLQKVDGRVFLLGLRLALSLMLGHRRVLFLGGSVGRHREKDPAAYVRLIASLLPKDIEKVPNRLEDLTDDELEQLDRLLDTACQAEEPAQ